MGCFSSKEVAGQPAPSFTPEELALLGAYEALVRSAGGPPLNPARLEDLGPVGGTFLLTVGSRSERSFRETFLLRVHRRS